MLSAFISRWRRARVRARPRVLVIDDWLPDPRIGSGAPRALAMLRAITAMGASLTMLPMLNDPSPADILDLLPEGEIAPGYGRAGMARFFAERKGSFDLIFVSRPHNMALLRATGAVLHEPGAPPVVYDSEALFAAREGLRRTVLGDPKLPAELASAIKDELALAEGARVVLTVTAREAEVFRAAGHSDVRVLGYAVSPLPAPTGAAGRDGFLFVGPTYDDDTPNSDSVVWFADHVMPQIRSAMVRDVPFVLAGMQQSAVVAARVNGVVRSLGPLRDLADTYAAARVFVAPTRFAAGIPLKVYDAAAHGVPAVVTPLIAEQLGWRHEEEALVAQTPQDFTTQCLRLHGDPDLWQQVRARALRRVAQDCDPRRFNRIVADVVRQAA